MRKLTVKNQDSKFKIYDGAAVSAEIIFDENNIDASLIMQNKILRVERGANKDIVLKDQSQTLFTFNFDYIWGGAEIKSNEIDKGFEIKGRWFKPGTRLTDDEDKDLVVAVKKNNELDVSILDERIDFVMILATIYYHIYSSNCMLLSTLMR